MSNEKFQEFLTVSWERVLSNKEDIIELFKMLNIKYLKNVQILSRTPLHNDRLTMMIGVSDVNGKSFRIIVDATSSIPTWGQFINVTYDRGNGTDVKIILYGKDFEEHSFDVPAGGFNEIGNLVRRNNRCGVKTLLVKGVDFDHNGQKIVGACEVEEGPDDVAIDEKQIFPSKRQVQEAEFWAGYYFPQWATDSIGFDDDIIDCWAPGYSLINDLRTEAAWNDEGFMISLIGEPGSEAIQWIWDNRRESFESAYPGCRSILRVQEGKPYAISVIIENLSMTDLINSEPADKWNYGDMVFGEEHKFQEVAKEAVDDYHNETKPKQLLAAS